MGKTVVRVWFAGRADSLLRATGNRWRVGTLMEERSVGKDSLWPAMHSTFRIPTPMGHYDLGNMFPWSLDLFWVGVDGDREN